MAEIGSRITIAQPSVGARIGKQLWAWRRLPLIPMFILAVFVATGLIAPLIAPLIFPVIYPLIIPPLSPLLSPLIVPLISH